MTKMWRIEGTAQQADPAARTAGGKTAHYRMLLQIYFPAVINGKAKQSASNGNGQPVAALFTRL